MNIPLANRVKKEAYRKMGCLQDILVEIVYSAEEGAVFHGGTSIWRCYGGNRFSEDLDFYLSPKSGFKEKFMKSATGFGAEVIKFKQTENTIFANIGKDGVAVKFEATLRKPKNPISVGYEKMDGNFLDILGLGPEGLLLEKLRAFRSRKLIRDIYDVYHLSRVAESGKISNEARELLKGLPQPVDEKNLRAIVFSGAVPGYSQMLQEINRRLLR